MSKLVGYLAALGNKELKPAASKKPAVKHALEISSKVGHLTILKKLRYDKGDVDGRGALYECQCRCGNTLSLSRKEVHARKRKKQGCLLPGCGIATGKDRVFTDMYECFRDQFRRLHVHHKEGLSIMWTGELDDLQSSFYLFADHMKDLGATQENGKWYIKREHNLKVYTEDRTTISDTDQLKGYPGEDVFVYEGEPISMDEAANIFGCRISDILDLQAEFISDEDIFESLM